MALPVKDSFLDLERHRLRLEENVAKLQKALQHWRTWDAEYEGLKEEIEAFHGDPQAEDIMAIGRDLGSTLVIEKEIRELLESDHKVRRNAAQVVDLISKRIEYVEENVKTVEKQLHIAEEKLNSILLVTKPDIRDEEGLPIMEIREELDDEGNIISSSARAPSDPTPQMLEALRKAGITDLNPTKIREPAKEKQARGPGNQSLSETSPKGYIERSVKATTPEGNCELGEDAGDSIVSPVTRKKVTFAPETKQESQSRSSPANGSKHPPNQPSVSETSCDAETRQFAEIFGSHDEQQTPVVPVDESPEDAALRREMLEYSLSEVGAVVAELTIGADGSDFSDADDYVSDGEGDSIETSSVDEEEDSYGRTTRRVISDDFRKEMEEMEKRLNARVTHNAWPNAEDPLLEEIRKDLRSLRAIKKHPTPSVADKPGKQPQEKPEKKSVRFAEELDISPAEQAISASGTAKSKSLASPLSSSMKNRTSPTIPNTNGALRERKPSKFMSSRISTRKEPRPTSFTTQEPESIEASRKSEPLKEGVFERNVPVPDTSFPSLAAGEVRNATFASPPIPGRTEKVRVVPESLPGKPFADGIVERPVDNAKAVLPDPDGLDPALLHQEVAMEYHRMRNRMIQREGGFMPREEELERAPLSAEEGGTGKKVSKFKAARLGKSAGL